MTDHPTLPDLDDLIAEVDRRCSSAYLATGDQPDWIELLKAGTSIAAELQALGDDLVQEYVEHSRSHGQSWAAIGEALGVFARRPSSASCRRAGLRARRAFLRAAHSDDPYEKGRSAAPQ